MWQQWVNFVVALWVIVSAFLGFSASAMTTNLVISGAIIAVLAVWGALSNASEGGSQRMRHI